MTCLSIAGKEDVQEPKMGHGKYPMENSSRYRSDRMGRSRKTQPDPFRRFIRFGERLDHHAGIRHRSFGQFPAGAWAPCWRSVGMQANRQMAANLLYASLHAPKVVRLDLHDLPQYRRGPAYLNALRTLDRPRSDLKAGERLGSSFTSRRRSMMISPCRWRRP